MAALLAALTTPACGAAAGPPTRAEATQTLRKAAGFFRGLSAGPGGYVWRYSADLSQREGEAKTTPTQAWVQPPGTPAIGEAFLEVRPRAMLCESDVTALGMIAGLHDAGVSVPGKMAVIGFDGIAEGHYSRPRLTTIAQPVDRLVALGLNALFQQIEEPDAPSECALLEPQLIIRESCGAVSNERKPR